MNINKLIVDLDTIVRSHEDETIGSALSLVESSHQPVFVFNKQNDFLGLVSPHEVLFRRRLPNTTKVASALVMPPKFTKDSSLYEMIDFMLSSRIYTVPIFELDKLVGQINLSELLLELANDKKLKSELAKVIEIKKPIALRQEAKVKEAYQVLRENKISRIIIIDDNDKLMGIVSRADIVKAFVKPSQKQRPSPKGVRPVYYPFDLDKIKRGDDPIRSYQTHKVKTISDSKKMVGKIDALINSKFNDLVIIDDNRIPVGIITSRDLLLALSKLKPKDEIRIIFNKPSANVSDEDVSKAYTFLHSLGKKINKRNPLDRIRISFEEPKTSHGDTVLFNTTLKLHFLDGSFYVANTKDLEFLESVRIAMNQVTKQIRRNRKNQY